MEKFADSVTTADSLLDKAKKIAKGSTMAEAGIDAKWLASYASIAERVDRCRRYGISRYPYEAGPSVNAFLGGFFDNKEWCLRKGLEKQASMRAVAEYEAKYVNAAGYWGAFHEAALDLRQESINSAKDEDAKQFDVWGIISVRYVMRVLGLRSEFYKMAAEDPTYAKMVLPTLEKRGEVVAADDLERPLADLDSHMATQLMKAVATMYASNATKKAKGGKGRAAEDN